MLKDMKTKIANDPKRKKGGPPTPPTPTDEELLRTNENYVPFAFRQFKAHQDILTYIKNDKYMIGPRNQGVCFGFSITEKGNGDVDVKLAFSGTEEDSAR